MLTGVTDWLMSFSQNEFCPNLYTEFLNSNLWKNQGNSAWFLFAQFCVSIDCYVTDWWVSVKLLSRCCVNVDRCNRLINNSHSANDKRISIPARTICLYNDDASISRAGKWERVCRPPLLPPLPSLIMKQIWLAKNSSVLSSLTDISDQWIYVHADTYFLVVRNYNSVYYCYLGVHSILWLMIELQIQLYRWSALYYIFQLFYTIWPTNYEFIPFQTALSF